jgi:hypothetical protein
LNRIFTIGGSGTSAHRSGQHASRRGRTESGYVVFDADQVLSARTVESVPVISEQQRMGLLQSSSIALFSLVLLAAVALGSMVGSAALLHLVSPSKQFNAFRALHEPAVVEVLLGLAILWVLPPHPWAMGERHALRRLRPFRSKAIA